MSKLSEFAHKAASLVVETDEETPKPAAKPAAGAPATHPAFHFDSSGNIPSTFPAPATASPFAVPTAAVVDENIYQSVLKKTSFDDTPVGKAVKKYFDALEGVIPDQTQRFRAAIGQAQKLENITPDQVLQTFDSLQAALDRDAQGFQQVAAGVEAREITARKNKIDDLSTQVTNLNSQIAQLSSDLADQTQKHSSTVTQYGLAQQRRATEIAQQKQQFASLLAH
jgi:outer membrane murein-binding lipoprotein Lpp